MENGELREIAARHVMYVETKDVPAGIARAFHELEEKLPNLRQRKFFGAMFSDRYWAGVEITSGDDPEAMGLRVGEIPGGVYACRKLKAWRPASLAQDIPRIFGELARGRRTDRDRPFVEFYRSQRELILQAPVAEAEDNVPVSKSW